MSTVGNILKVMLMFQTSFDWELNFQADDFLDLLHCGFKTKSTNDILKHWLYLLLDEKKFPLIESIFQYYVYQYLSSICA